ncbi:MAG TPA: isocitrate lyase/phosphoenolpyruvate mutase family protein [Terriglobales bacterium]|nr:isocitrate lyase/phosphoenolpyruvate mutase family protein [Terriglobales bacterium]
MTDISAQAAKAETLRQLHRGPKLLVLLNAWDVASARIFEETGAPAIATTSAGIAFSLGYPDGEKIPREEMASAVARIASKVRIPVSADMEAGYGPRPEDAALTAKVVIEAGAVGMNLEDGTGNSKKPLADLSLQLEKIPAVIETGRKAGVPLVLNARTDIYLRQVGAPETRFEEALRRLNAFRDAGADCLFIPGVRDLPTIERFVRELRHPINILAGPGSPSISELQNAGVARVTIGSGAMRATLGLTNRIARELFTSGTYANLEGAVAGTEVNRMLT